MGDNFAILTKITETRAWQRALASHPGSGGSWPWAGEDFATYWIVAGHHIRAQISDDAALARFLRLVLPAYSSGAVLLYRGENLQRFRSGSVGFAWSSSERVARMFAGGLNAVQGGGVLLRAELDAPAIISGPNLHSSYLGEHQFTVDPGLCKGVSVVTTLPSAA